MSQIEQLLLRVIDRIGIGDAYVDPVDIFFYPERDTWPSGEARS